MSVATDIGSLPLNLIIPMARKDQLLEVTLLVAILIVAQLQWTKKVC